MEHFACTYVKLRAGILDGAFYLVSKGKHHILSPRGYTLLSFTPLPLWCQEIKLL